MTDVLSTDFSEPGFLKRLRNWRDAMPWLVLGECLGPAMSIVAIVFSVIALHLGAWGVFALERTLADRFELRIPEAAVYPPELRDSFSPNLLPADSQRIAPRSVVSVHSYVTSPLRLMSQPENTLTVLLIRLAQRIARATYA